MLEKLIDCFNTPIQVTRYNAAVAFVDGVEQPVTSTSMFCVSGVSVQPTNGRERVLLPELIRDKETVKIYSKVRLRGVDVAGKVLADRITYDDERWVVHSCTDWYRHEKYYKVIAVKEND